MSSRLEYCISCCGAPNGSRFTPAPRWKPEIIFTIDPIFNARAADTRQCVGGYSLESLQPRYAAAAVWFVEHVPQLGGRFLPSLEDGFVKTVGLTVRCSNKSLYTEPSSLKRLFQHGRQRQRHHVDAFVQ